MHDHDAHDIIVLFSNYAAETPTPPKPRPAARPTPSPTPGDCRGPGVKGEYAYLAPNAAGLLHGALQSQASSGRGRTGSTPRGCALRALLIPNAGHLAAETITRIEAVAV